MGLDLSDGGIFIYPLIPTLQSHHQHGFCQMLRSDNPVGNDRLQQGIEPPGDPGGEIGLLSFDHGVNIARAKCMSPGKACIKNNVFGGALVPGKLQGNRGPGLPPGSSL